MLPLVAALAGVGRRSALRGIAWRDRWHRLSNWMLRALPERHGRTTLILLALILALGFGLRAYRVVEPLGTPGDDAHAYYALSKALYEEGSYGGPSFRDASDWSPGAPLLYAASLLRDRRRPRRDGADRRAAARAGGDRRRLPARPPDRLPPGRADRRLRRRRLPAVHPLDRRPLQRAAGDLHPARRGPRLPLGERAGARCRRLARCPGFLFGLTALIRPEYLLVGVAFAAARRDPGRPRARLAAGPRRRRRCSSPRCLVPIVPWTIRNSVVLDRAVPISTGGGKALYVGTFLPADGEYQRVKALLVERYLHRDLEPGLRSARTGRPDAALRPRRRPLSRPAARLGPRQDRQAELLQVLRRRPGRLRGDDRAQGLADVERRRRRSDERDRRPGRPGADRRCSAWPASACSPGAAAGGSWSRWRRRSSSSPRSAPPRWRPRAATRS